MNAPLDVKLFGYYPGANCTKCEHSQTCGGQAHEWDFQDIKASLLSTYGDRIRLSLIDVFSEEVKNYPDVVEHLRKYGLRIPILMIEGEIISCGGEANEDIVRKVLDFLLAEQDKEAQGA
jgi:disulfide oxidoreductase YuzD